MENKIERALRRQIKVRSRISKEGFRLSVTRSNRFLFAQVIDLKTGKTILGLGDSKLLGKKEIEGKLKTEKAKLFGEKFAGEVLKKEVKKVSFDRGSYRFHGRIKAFAEGLRSGGLLF